MIRLLSETGLADRERRRLGGILTAYGLVGLAVILLTLIVVAGSLGAVIDVGTTIQRQRDALVRSLDAADTLSKFMVDDLPDPARFLEAAASLFGAAVKAASGRSNVRWEPELDSTTTRRTGPTGVTGGCPSSRASPQKA